MSKNKGRWAANKRPSKKKFYDTPAGKATPTDVHAYLTSYHINYSVRYHSFFTEAPPKGAGYPKLVVSPYPFRTDSTCYLAKDGAIVAFRGYKNKQWEGVTLNIETNGYSDYVTLLPEPKYTVQTSVDEEDTGCRLYAFDLTIEQVFNQLTCNGMRWIFQDNEVIKEHSENFWHPLIIKNMRFQTSDLKYIHSFEQMEIYFHTDKAAWDIRSVHARIMNDIRRDFARAAVTDNQKDGVIISGGTEPYSFYEKLDTLRIAIEKFKKLLDENAQAPEQVFHDFLKQYPIILDAYAQRVHSKPRWPYPNELIHHYGKAYVEPDFVIKYPDNSYKLIELEKPGKNIATQQGQPSAGTNQAVFQTAEWLAYIGNHYDLLKDDYPSISTRVHPVVVISRTTEFKARHASRSVALLKEHLSQMYEGKEILFYDDLLERAMQMYQQLATLGVMNTAS